MASKNTASVTSASDSADASDDAICASSVTASAAQRRPLLPPCRICGGKASGYHYGANTCEACKGFFRRTISGSLTYSCPKQNNCPILPGRRNNCSACRIKRCGDEGMSKSAIRTGRYSYKVHTKYIKEVKSKTSSTTQSNDKTASNKNHLEPETSSKLCRNSNSGLKKPVSEQTDLGEFALSAERNSSGGSLNRDPGVENAHENEAILHKLMEAQKGSSEDLDEFLDRIKMLNRQRKYKEEWLKAEASKQEDEDDKNKTRMAQMQEVAIHMDSELRKAVTFIKAIPGWKDIHIEDQVSLIKESAVEVWLIGHHQCMNLDLGVFTGEFNTTAMESVHIYSDEYIECLYRTGAKFSELNLQKEEVVILKAIVFTFTDRCTLVNREAVEKVQTRMIDCYATVCQKLGLNFSQRFSRVVSKLMVARELSEKFKSVVATVVSHWKVLESYPLLLEFYSGNRV